MLEGLGYRLVLREPSWHGHRMSVTAEEPRNTAAIDNDERVFAVVGPDEVSW
jgi:hypothetical protein